MPFLPHIAIFPHSEWAVFSAVERAGMIPVAFSWDDSADKLITMDGFIIAGEFSEQPAVIYPLMETIKVQTELGKPLLGIGNGGKWLVGTGLVPGLENNKPAITLIENECAVENPVAIRLSNDYQRNAFTQHLTLKSLLSLPSLHSSRFIMTAALQQEIEIQGLNVFQYCDALGQVTGQDAANWAALSNKAGNVMAMLPHPEKTPEGDAIFQSMRDYILDGSKIEKTVPLYYYPRRK